MSRFGLGFTSAGVPGNDSFTKSLLHLDGANGGTSFPDVNAGGSAKTWTATNTFGTSTTTTANPKFGTASLITSNTVTFISTPYSPEFDLTTSDFTIDFWFNNNNAPGGGSSGIVGNPLTASLSLADTTWYFMRTGTSGSSSIQFTVGNGSTISQINGTTNILGNAWHHIAVTRAGGVIRYFIDGVQQGSNLSWASIPIKAAPITIGVPYTNAGGIPNAMYDEFRLSVGIARWTTNFTPPIAAYT